MEIRDQREGRGHIARLAHSHGGARPPHLVEGVDLAREPRDEGPDPKARDDHPAPAMLEAYSDGLLFDAIRHGAEQAQAYKGKGLTPEEYAVMVIIAEDLTHKRAA